MCRHKFSNQPNLGRFIAERLIIANNRTNRALIVIEMTEPNWLKTFAESLSIPYIDKNDNIDRADKITALLGTESRVLAHLVAEPLDAGLLAALSGTVSNRGILILGIPYALGKTTDTDDSPADPVHLFTQRFKRQLAAQILQHPLDVFHFRIDDSNSDVSVDDLPTLNTPVSDLLEDFDLGTSNNNKDNNQSAIIEQEGLLGEAIQHLSSHETACVAIIGKRGRGKSSLLARVANHYHREDLTCAVTAHNQAALGSFHKLTDHNSEDYVYAIEKLGSASIDLLLVDEAGNLSIDTLTGILTNHKKVVLCTTVEGYENAGRAFETRFLKTAINHTTPLLTLRPQEPWRWLKQDPIEEFLDQLLLTNARSDSLDSVKKIEHPNQLQIRQASQQELAKNESLLRSIHTLLRDTHYQSSVKDLQHLLDGKLVQIWIVNDEITRALIAVALVSIESDIDPSLHNDILNKRRRLPHQLLLQLLAQTANTTDALSACFARVIRISVNENYRRQGVATALLHTLEEQLLIHSSDKKIQALGASFANDVTSQRFWSKNGYLTFHKGFKKNPRTGTHAVAVLKTDDENVSAVLAMACRIHEDNRQSRNKNLSITTFMENQNRSDGNSENSISDDLSLLRQFSMGHRSAHDTHAALSRLALSSGGFSLDVPESQSRRSFEKALQKQVSTLINK